MNDVTTAEQTISGWGRVGVAGYETLSTDLVRASEGAQLFRGLGRSYGDSSLPAHGGPVVSTKLADRLIAFDAETGLLRAESGLSLHALNRLFLPRGFFTPVTPGTQFVTLGGMVASDVHGKEHHVRGCFGEHVTKLKVRVADGRIIDCSDTEHADLFRGCIGGMGLLGHILEVEFRMMRIPTNWIFQDSERVPNVEAYIERLHDQKTRYPYTVGWIDCLRGGNDAGRGILMAGRWAEPGEAPRPQRPRPRPRVALPFSFPEFALGPLTVRAFNFGFYWKHFAKQQKATLSWEPFFYPLDLVEDWNLMYGPRGFTQYQCVLPEASGPSGWSRKVLDKLASLGGASFLCVIKDCGPEGKGTLSFPMPGVSIALDIPVRDDTQKLVDALNEIVLAAGGRIYLSKDQFTRREHFAAMEQSRLQSFLATKAKWDPQARFQSAQSVRLLGDLRA